MQGPTFGFEPGEPSPLWNRWLLPAPIVTKQKGFFAVREEQLFAGGFGANGTKARALWALACLAKEQGKSVLCTAGTRSSTQSLMLCRIAQALEMDYEFHTASGPETEIMAVIREAGFQIAQHKPGYVSVCRSRARKAAEADSSYCFIDRGVEGPDMPLIVEEAASKISYAGVRRLVVPCGSGMTISGILRAIAKKPPEERPERILGIRVGAKVRKRIAKFGPKGCCLWPSFLIKDLSDFNTPGPSEFHGIICDPHYSGKASEFVKRGDMLWNSGSRHLALKMP